MLKFYHRGLLSKKWKEYKFILYDSSLLTWYSDVKHKKPDGMILLKDVERFICVGPYTRFLPDFPHLDNEYDQVALIAFPMSVKDRDRDIIWLLCADIDDLNSWMKAIVQTLPSHTLRMEKLPNTSSPPIEETIKTPSELNASEINSPEPLMLKTESIGLPLIAGLVGSRLQGHTMDSKVNPLRKAGYDYGDGLWGTGEGWGYSSPLIIPGFAAMGGSGCYADHLDLIRDEQQVEDRIGETADDEGPIYELSKNEIDDKREEREATNTYENDDKEDEIYQDDDPDFSAIEDDLKMIDSDIEK